MELVYHEAQLNKDCGLGTETPNLTANTCTNHVHSEGYYLSSIATEGDSASFVYATRNDCLDVLLTDIKIYNTVQAGNLLQQYHFYYNYYNNVPYLSILSHLSDDLSSSLDYRFKYNDPGSRPARLSYSQDHWGYYNGKGNTTLLPHVSYFDPPDYIYSSYFSDATADRDPDFQYAVKGMLNEIFYPTGGMDSIIYEANKADSLLTGYPPITYRCYVTGTDFDNTVSKNIPFDCTADPITMDIQAICNATDCDPLHQISNVWIKDNGGTTMYHEVFNTGTDTTVYVSLTPGSYTLIISANGSAVTTDVALTYKSSSTSFQYRGGVTGGIRVKALLSGNPDQTPLYKRYYYSEDINDLNASSLIPGFNPVYVKSYTSDNFSIDQVGTDYVLGQCIDGHDMLYSTSLLNLYDYCSGLTSYSSVIESDGENFADGGVQTKYMVGWDELGNVLWGNDIMDAPMTNGSIFYNGKVKEEVILKKGSNGNIFPVRKTTYHYTEDSRGFHEVPGYVIFQKFSTTMQVDTTCMSGTDDANTNYSCLDLLDLMLGRFDMVAYYVYGPWTYLDTLTETVYDENGQNPSATTTRYYYDNEFHQQVTRTETYNSKGELIKTTHLYPSDYASGTGSNVYDLMLNDNMLTPVVDTKVENGSNTVSEVKRNYADWGNGSLAPSSYEQSFKGAALENIGTINSYDAYGNITEYVGRDGVTNAIIWGYDGHYPAAKVSGATYSQAIAQLTVSVANLQSLEGTTLQSQLDNIRAGLPGALITTFTYQPGVGVTSITDVNDQTQSYEYDHFGRLHLVRDNDGNILKRNDYAYPVVDTNAIFKIYFNTTTIGKYDTCQNCVQGTEGSVSSYSISPHTYLSVISEADANAQAAAALDSLAQIYANLHGYCSNQLSCSANDRKFIDCSCETGTKFRTAVTENSDSSCTFTYHYQWSDGSVSPDYTENGPCVIYYSEAMSQDFTKNDCGAGYAGTTVTYTVPDSTYSSMLSDRDVFEKTLNDINTNGQAYANANGSCQQIYYNAAISDTFTRSDCSTGYIGTQVVYTVPDNTYTSLLSQADADQQAQNDVNANGQTYANTNGSCLFVYYNVEKSGSFTRDNCGTGNTGSTVAYTVPDSTYTSTLSQADADQQAQDDVDANGQTYANANGTCTCNSSTCTGEGYKCVNGVCEYGVKVYTSSVQVSSHLYECTYHYEWSDGSWSQDYTEDSPTACSLMGGGV